MREEAKMESPELAALPEHGSRGYVYVVCTVAAVGGLLFGFDTAVISGAIVFVERQFGLTSFEKSFAVASVLIGCAVGVAAVGSLCDRFGRKKILIAAAGFFAISALGCAIARNFMELTVARFIGGLAVGVASMVSPMYIAEIAPARIRGRLVVLNQMTIVCGILCANLTNWALEDTGIHNWRYMFVSEAPGAALFFFALFAVPESPRWLTQQGRLKEALGILARVGGRRHAQVELGEIREAIAHEAGSIRQLFRPGLRLALVIGVVMAILQQITGINTVIYYAPDIFLGAGVGSDSAALLATVGVGTVNVASTVVALCLVDKVGRRLLMLIGTSGMAVSLFFAGLSFHGGRSPGMLVLIPILCYIVSFGIGLGPVVWVVIAEIFPTRIRGRAMAIATVALWIACFAVAYSFPPLIKAVGFTWPFWGYGVVCVLTVLFVAMVVPETKGKPLEEIEKFWEPRGGAFPVVPVAEEEQA